MKAKLLLTSIVLFTVLNSFAQKNIPKGSTLLGGNISYSKHTIEYPQQVIGNSQFNISPVFGTAVKDNLFIGLSLGAGIFKRTYNNVYVDSTKGYSLNYGVFVRKYIPLKYNFYIFLQGDLGGSNYKEKPENNSPGNEYYSKQFSAGLSLTPGIAYAINSKLQLETGFGNILGVGYSQVKYNDNINNQGLTKEENFSASINVNNFSSQLYFGFRILLQKKDKMVASK